MSDPGDELPTTEEPLIVAPPPAVDQEDAFLITSSEFVQTPGYRALRRGRRARGSLHTCSYGLLAHRFGLVGDIATPGFLENPVRSGDPGRGDSRESVGSTGSMPNFKNIKEICS